jgi:hypothetical protein
MTAMLRRTSKAAAPIIPAALLAGLGLPALGALIFLAILVLVTACWVIDDADRTEQVCRILLAGRGDTNCLPPPGRCRQARRSPAIPASPLAHVAAQVSGPGTAITPMHSPTDPIPELRAPETT